MKAMKRTTPQETADIVRPDEVTALQSIGQELERLGNRIASDESLAKQFLTATLTANRTPLAELLESFQVKPSAMGSMSRIGSRGQGELGVKESSYRILFNMGRFRVSLGFDEI